MRALLLAVAVLTGCGGVELEPPDVDAGVDAGRTWTPDTEPPDYGPPDKPCGRRSDPRQCPPKPDAG